MAMLSGYPVTMPSSEGFCKCNMQMVQRLASLTCQKQAKGTPCISCGAPVQDMPLYLQASNLLQAPPDPVPGKDLTKSVQKMLVSLLCLSLNVMTC